jgi:hypothetical protein
MKDVESIIVYKMKNNEYFLHFYNIIAKPLFSA